MIKKVLKYIFRPTLERSLARTIIFFLSQLTALGVNNYVKEICNIIQNENPDNWKYILASIIEFIYADYNLPALIGSLLIIILLFILIRRKEPEFNKLEIFNSEEEAYTNLGENKRFRYSIANLDGVPSPNNSALGLTRK
jgi:hypothetical protein